MDLSYTGPWRSTHSCSSFFWKTLCSNHDDKIGILLRGSGDLTSRVRSKALYVLTFLATLPTESHDPLSTDILTVGSDFAFPWACKQRAFSCQPLTSLKDSASRAEENGFSYGVAPPDELLALNFHRNLNHKP